MLQDIDWVRRDKVVKVLEEKLREQEEEAYKWKPKATAISLEGQGKWDKNMVEVKAIANRISTEKDSLQRSSDNALLHGKDLKKRVFELTDKVVYALASILIAPKRRSSFFILI